MKKYIFILLLFLVTIVDAQESKEDSWLSIQISYGPQYNNFVDYGQEIRVEDDAIIPIEGFPGEATLFQKREIGTYFNVTANIRLGGRNYLEIGHSRTSNQGLYNITIPFDNGTVVEVEAFQLRSRNHFNKLGYKRAFLSEKLYGSIGLALTAFQNSNILISPSANRVEIYERNAETVNSGELSAYIGFQYDFYKSGQFTLGVQSTAYVIVSAGFELETFAIVPTLKFQF
jgi:hypothetical protein